MSLADEAGRILYSYGVRY